MRMNIEDKYSIEDIFCSKGRTKIIKTLALNKELNISKIIKNTNLNHSAVMNHLRFLIKINLIQEKSFGRIKIYRFREENLKAHCIKKMIELLEDIN